MLVTGALIASYGHMGIEADLTKMSDSDRSIMKDAVERYKQDRHIWHSGIFHRIRTVDPNLIGALSVTGDKSAARLVLSQIDRPRSTIPPRIRIPGLDPVRNYRIISQFMSEHVTDANRTMDNPLFGGGITLSGRTLETVGIGLPSLYAQTGLAIAIDADKKE